MDKFRFFRAAMDLCDWRDEGNDEKVLAPVIAYLARQDDSVIYHFDDLMSWTKETTDFTAAKKQPSPCPAA